MKELSLLRIGDLAAATGTKIVTIRYYEKIGLLPAPPRTGGNYRAYSQTHQERLSFIRRSRALGFTLDEIRELLDLSAETERDCAAVDRLVTSHLAEVEDKIADLQRLASELRRMKESCRGGTIDQCRIIEALSLEPVTL
ncbi:Cu(I)-responsive transcriptional regulator [Rhodopseudomonas julia]|uniref:Cu(I)-responsive transcriptional regulator n=1 Tax=Rhodopseudomonas julia TaxID=200617 RepID=A0ABU0CBW5_9BRAD|nr:helix-turn-helix domain-containing protein [Rhodopseudomonas julia]MDQ0327110.1 Cu(I)-responsive transcriptional regulator [Rhodopseudomonas julia]